MLIPALVNHASTGSAAPLTAVAGEPLLAACYAEAEARGYRWHEFGDVNLLLRR